MPLPNVRFGEPAGSRVMSNFIGSGNTFSSVFAATKLGEMNEPRGNKTSRYSMSSEANRPVPRIEPSTRMLSSVARAASSGRSPRSRH